MPVNTAQELKRRNRLAVSKRRAAEEIDAFDFILGHDLVVELHRAGKRPIIVPLSEADVHDGPEVTKRRVFHNPHKCVRAVSGGESCSRDYDPKPYAQTVGWVEGVPDVISRRQKALPAGEYMYVGTGIGALYGLGGEEHLWTLAGWNVTR